jgi:hypothetical protein
MAQGEGQRCLYLRSVITLPLEAHQSGSFSDEQAKSLFFEVMCYFPYMLVRTRSLYVITHTCLQMSTMPQPVSVTLALDIFPTLRLLIFLGRL